MGCGTALVTPFRGDSSVDEAGLRALVEWQIESGISFLVPCGTTGEAATLSEQEWLRVVEVVVETAAGRVPVFGGCTNNSTHEAVAKAKKLAQVSGTYGRPDRESVLQQARAGGPVPALSRDCGGCRPSGAAVQHSRAHGREPGAGDGASAGGASERDRDQGVEREYFTDYGAADDGPAGLQGLRRRRLGGAAGHRTRWRGAGFGGLECDSGGDVGDGASRHWQATGRRRGISTGATSD